MKYLLTTDEYESLTKVKDEIVSENQELREEIDKFRFGQRREYFEDAKKLEANKKQFAHEKDLYTRLLFEVAHGGNLIELMAKYQVSYTLDLENARFIMIVGKIE